MRYATLRARRRDQRRCASALAAVSRAGIATPAASSGAQVTSHTATASASPFRASSPMATNRWVPRPRHKCRTMSLARICPPLALAHNRAASVTGIPCQSPSVAVASPADSPTRSPTGSPPWRRLSRTIACCIRTAALSASIALLKTAMTWSPAVLISAPRLARKASRTDAKCCLRNTSHRSDPMRSSCAVDSTRSVKSTVTTCDSATARLSQHGLVGGAADVCAERAWHARGGRRRGHRRHDNGARVDAGLR